MASSNVFRQGCFSQSIFFRQRCFALEMFSQKLGSSSYLNFVPHTQSKARVLPFLHLVSPTCSETQFHLSPAFCIACAAKRSTPPDFWSLYHQRSQTLAFSSFRGYATENLQHIFSCTQILTAQKLVNIFDPKPSAPFSLALKISLTRFFVVAISRGQEFACNQIV